MVAELVRRIPWVQNVVCTVSHEGDRNWDTAHSVSRGRQLNTSLISSGENERSTQSWCRAPDRESHQSSVERSRNGKSAAATGISTRGQKLRIHQQETRWTRHAGESERIQVSRHWYLTLAKWKEVLQVDLGTDERTCTDRAVQWSSEVMSSRQGQEGHCWTPSMTPSSRRGHLQARTPRMTNESELMGAADIVEMEAPTTGWFVGRDKCAERKLTLSSSSPCRHRTTSHLPTE